jgi:hypothetical protein
VGVVGEANKARDVEFEYIAGGVSGSDECGLGHVELLQEEG